MSYEHYLKEQDKVKRIVARRTERVMTPCPDCKGSGEYYEVGVADPKTRLGYRDPQAVYNCGTCHGTGEIVKWLKEGGSDE